jgi:hypothetical protein
MVKSYGEFLNEDNNQNRNWKEKNENGKGVDKKTDENPYYSVWNSFPSYKDIDSTDTLKKAISLVIIEFVLFASLLLTTVNIMLSISAIIIVGFSFVLVFRKSFFSLRHLLEIGAFNPFQNLTFWQTDYDKSVLFYTNRIDMITTGIRTLKVEVMAENVSANLLTFIKGLNKNRTPYTFQVIHKPLQITDSKSYDKNSTFETVILFSTYYKISGKITKSKLTKLVEELQLNTIALKTGFSSNFHHFKVSSLTDQQLVGVFRNTVLKRDVPIESDSKRITCKTVRPKLSASIIKASYIVALVVLLDLSLLFFNLPLIYKFLLNIGIIILLLIVWWQELFFQLSKGKLFKSKEVKVIDPFTKIEFFKSKKTPETIFYQIEGKTTGGIKMANLYFCSPPPYCNPAKFYESLNKEGMSFTVTFQLGSLNLEKFYEEGFEYLTEREKFYLMKRGSNPVQRDNWFRQKAGIWSAIATYSTSFVSNSPSLTYETMDVIERRLIQQFAILKSAFGNNFMNFRIKPLRNNLLESGLVFEALKNKFFRRNGTHLNYLLFQGKTLEFLTMISNQFKKGVETRLAAEFNTPLQLKNEITVGSTINTEYLENEVPAGFLFDQVRNLFVTNGTNSSRELLTQKIVVELVKAGYPSVVFDFTGNWSKIMRIFQGSIYESQIIYHKLGKTIVINPLRSGIPYDKNNLDYMDYMFDAYAMCFKKDERTIETFKNTVLRNPDIDVSTLVLDLTTQRDWEKSSVTETLLSFFREFSPQESSFIQHQQPQTQDAAQAHDFITNDKTIIIDFSDIRDYDKQCYFAFVVLSKFIHYLKTGESYISKFIILPHIDVVFDGFFLDKKIQYGKIDKFFTPFVDNGFGTVFSASQIRYLHPNVFNYFENIVTFRANDKRDVAVLNGQMNLENLHGVGYYSNRRNEGYQTRYIGAMKKNEAVVKREDIYQSFPVQLDFEELQQTKPLSWKEIVSYMGDQGYDLEKTERKIMKRAQTTLFESDFAGYSDLIEGIIKFLNNLQAVDKVGNLYKKKVKDELRKILRPYITRITKDKKREKEIIDNVFAILVSKQYLVESHPRRASGSESMQTSFAVGLHYQKVLKDYYDSRDSSIITYEPVELDSTQLPAAESLNPINLRSALSKHFAPILYYEYFTMHKNLNHKKYEKVIKTARDLFPKFLHTVYKEYYSVNYAITSEDIDNFIGKIGNTEEFPFTKEDLKQFLTSCEKIEIKDQAEVTQTCKNTFEMYSTIFDGIRQYVEGDLGGETI